MIKRILVAQLMLFVVSCGYRTVQLTGNSMRPSFNDGQRLLVDENAYASTHPARGDVILFRTENLPKVSRIIGLPGEEVTIRDGAVYLADQTHPDSVRLGEPYLSSDVVTMPVGGKSVYQVHEDQYFVLGDNRGGSSDSRTFGPISKKEIVGKVRAFP